jgi:uncharacterized protein
MAEVVNQHAPRAEAFRYAANCRKMNLMMRVMAERATRIGLISDTHGLMRPEALRSLEGSDLIIHAGDVGKPEILDRLRAVAPVVAVRGNVDQGEWASALPMTAVVETRRGLIYVLHDVQQMDLDPAAAGFGMIVSGHSHKPGQSERCGVICVNPGSAGPRRFRLPIMVARLDLNGPEWKVEWIELPDGGLGA